jgi:hypothetical protein
VGNRPTIRVTGERSTSDQFIAWGESLSGFLSTVKVKYGGAANMVERPDWDDSKTEYAVQLVRSLRRHLSKLEQELSQHVEAKYRSNGVQNGRRNY